MGEILYRTRLSEDMFRGLVPWMRWLPGGLLHTNIAGCTIFAAVSGSSAATLTTVGKMSIPELRQRGYPEYMIIGTLASAHDAKEVFFWGREVAPDDPDVLAGLPLVHPNQWPDRAAPFLREGILPYYEAVMALGLRILTCLANGLGADPDIFVRAYDRPLGRGQLVYYPALGEEDVAAQRFGAAEHSDFGVLTTLQQDNLGGLQVRNRSDEWIEAMPIDNTFVCNIGDLLERWTNGRLVSTPHRVLNRSGKSRFSIPIFCDPSSDAIVDPRDFDPEADINILPPIAAGAYIASKSRRNFSHYETEKS